jgi:threonine dehydratase
MKAIRSPLVSSGANLFLKAEHLQPLGSFKARGVARLLEAREAPPQGYSTASAGNLGRTLAYACRDQGIPCTVYVPDTTPELKREKIEALGAALVVLPFADLWDLMLNPPAHAGFIHPIRCPELLAGYGGIAREIADELPSAGAVVVPFGLGGLALGIAREMRRLRPDVKIYAAELAEQAPFRAALEGRAAEGGKPASAAFVDVLGCPTMLPGIFEEARMRLAGSLCVNVGEIRESLAELQRTHGYVVEGASAAAHAAAKKLAGEGVVSVAVLSGGNIAPEVHARESAVARQAEKFIPIAASI